jgi:hypothetical protein
MAYRIESISIVRKNILGYRVEKREKPRERGRETQVWEFEKKTQRSLDTETTLIVPLLSSSQTSHRKLCIRTLEPLQQVLEGR